MLVRCLYASRAVTPVGDATLDDILKQSRRNNPRHGITGMLCLANGVFVQVIEGGRTEVSRLMGRIFSDPRHVEVELLLHEEIAQRLFGKWTMGQVSIGSVNPALLLKYSPRPELNPFVGPASATLALLLDIAESGNIAQRAT